MFKKSISTLIVFLLAISYVYADKVKVGMITTLSGGGSGLGIDIRDGFALAVKDEPNIEIISGDAPSFNKLSLIGPSSTFDGCAVHLMPLSFNIDSLTLLFDARIRLIISIFYFKYFNN